MEACLIGKLFSWLHKTPKFTTYRVNTLFTTSLVIVKVLEDELLKQAAARAGHPSPPRVLIHPVLREVVVVGPWDESSLALDHRPKEVVVDTACGVAVLRGAHVFAPGVMGMLPNIRIGDFVSVYADINNTCRQGLMTVLPVEDKLFLGNGIARMDRSQLFGKDVNPSGVAIEMTDPVSGCPSVSACLPPGSALLQNLPSVVCGLVLNPQPGDAVLDMCASPGNKTSHLATLMHDQGIIIAIDKNAPKIKAIKERCAEFGITCVRAFAFNSTKAVCGSSSGDEPPISLENGPPFVPEIFDRILLDAPCSGLGQRPLLANKTTRKHVASYPPLQKALFRAAVTLLKPGGTLVYSTCTITVAENEGLVSWALETFPCLTLKPAMPALGGPGWEGSTLDNQHRKCVLRFGPPPPGVGQHYDFDNVGFFIAHFVKKGKLGGNFL